jgi:hypothetical protein
MKKRSTFLLIAIAILFSAQKIYAQDGILTHVVPQQKYLKTGYNYTVSAWVQNNAGAVISSFKVGWKLDNGTATLSNSINISGGLQTGGYYFPYSFSAPMNVSTTGSHTLYVWVQATGETNPSNDTVKVNFTALSSYSDKIVLFEEYTSLTCTSCPAGDISTDSILKRPDAAVARFHFGDGLACTDGETYYDNSYFPSGTIYTPSGVIDMSEFGQYAVNSYSTAWISDIDQRVGEISPMSLTITPDLNTGTRVLNVTLTANFKLVETGDYYMNLYVLENGLVATQQGTTNNIHNQVVRAMLGGSTGTTGVIPASPVVSTDYTHTYTYTVPTGYDLTRLSLIGLVFQKDINVTGIINCAKYTYDHTGIADFNSGKINAITTYPNPCNKEFTCVIPNEGKTASLTIYSSEGRLVYSNEFKVSDRNIHIDMSEYCNGLYNVILKTENNIYSSKIIKN